jgi:proline iminopeptidase
MAKYERLGQYDAPAYRAATDSFYARFLTRKAWSPAASPGCQEVRSFNEQVYRYMWGPTEFKAIGELKNIDRTGRLHELTLPVLFTAAQYDGVRPEPLYGYQKAVKGTQVAIIANAGHLKTIDNPAAYTKSDPYFSELGTALKTPGQWLIIISQA